MKKMYDLISTPLMEDLCVLNLVIFIVTKHTAKNARFLKSDPCVFFCLVYNEFIIKELQH